MEIWRDVFGYDGEYQVSDLGRVKSLKGREPRILKFKYDKESYLQVILSHKNIQKTHKVHRLVLETFVGPCPQGMECRHLDDNKSNNNVDNLKWGTHKENCVDRKINNRNCEGENHGVSKLKNSDIVEILSLLKMKRISYQNIASLYGVDAMNIYAIASGKTWRHVTGFDENNNLIYVRKR